MDLRSSYRVLLAVGWLHLFGCAPVADDDSSAEPSADESAADPAQANMDTFEPVADSVAAAPSVEDEPIEQEGLAAGVSQDAEFDVLAGHRCGFVCQLFGGGSSGGGATDGSGDGGSSGDGSGGDPFVRGADPTKTSASRAGPYRVRTYTSGFPDHRAFAGGTVHYPVDAQAPFASVAVVPGFVSPESSIRAWGPFLASHGIVTMTIATNSGGDQPDARAAALMGALEILRGEHTRANSPLRGKLDTSRQAVMGWSMGGGGALIAAEKNPQLKAAISMAGWSPGRRFSNNRVPSLLFAATSDPLAGGQSQGFYNSMPSSTPKMLFEVQGSSHSVANDPANHNGEIGRYGLSWMKVFLEEDTRYRPFLTARPDTRMATFTHNL